MVNNQQLLQMVLSRCTDPRMKNIIQSGNNPKQIVSELCKTYPDIANQIDGAIGQGYNPQQLVMQMLNRK